MAEGETALAGVELQRGDAEIGEHSAGLVDALVRQDFLQLVETRAHQARPVTESGEALGCELKGFCVTVES